MFQARSQATTEELKREFELKKMRELEMRELEF